jgi:hypothetical protein
MLSLITARHKLKKDLVLKSKQELMAQFRPCGVFRILATIVTLKDQ